MIIEKPFWIREHKDKSVHAYSYENPQNVHKFAKQYGGEVRPQLSISEQASLGIPEDMEVCSLIRNPSDDKPTMGEKPYKVLADGELFDSGHPTIKEANTVAKNIYKYFTYVVVIKAKEELAIDETLYEF